MNYFEQVFFSKIKDQKEGEIYYKQWEITKEYIPQVLDTVSFYFPHYTLHDCSHSEKILNNITRVIGKENVEKLSIVDLWLMLSAAYYHDCGMSIDKEDLQLLKSNEFLNYMEEAVVDKSHSMHKFGKLFKIVDNKIYYKKNTIKAKNINSVKFLIADFLRVSHAKRSNNKIIKSNSLRLPGIYIPERIIKILGKICLAHGGTREFLMSLPRSEESGCGAEDCHPLYIACLLRIGDLLDIDSNRISEIVLNTLPDIPTNSKYYLDSNKSISHIRIDRKYIDIQATCRNYETAEILNNWFQWIDDELTFQMKNWNKIIPDQSYSFLPTVGKLEVSLKKYDTFDGKNPPRFNINTKKAIEFIQGTGIYESKF